MPGSIRAQPHVVLRLYCGDEPGLVHMVYLSNKERLLFLYLSVYYRMNELDGIYAGASLYCGCAKHVLLHKILYFSVVCMGCSRNGPNKETTTSNLQSKPISMLKSCKVVLFCNCCGGSHYWKNGAQFSRAWLLFAEPANPGNKSSTCRTRHTLLRWSVARTNGPMLQHHND